MKFNANSDEQQLDILFDPLIRCLDLEDATSAPHCADVLKPIVEFALNSSHQCEVLAKLIGVIEHTTSNKLVVQLINAFEAVVSGTSMSFTDDDIKTYRELLHKSVQLLLRLPSKERVHVALRILPLLMSFISKTALPIPASAYFTEIVNACRSDAGFDVIISEMVCVVLNNPLVFEVDDAFVKAPDVWFTVRNAISQSGILCQRALNSLENLVNYCQKHHGLEFTVADQNEVLFRWSKKCGSNADTFWQTYIALFTSLETSQSAHVIDPFLAKVRHLFSTWSSLDISAYWLELFCQRASGLGNFSVSKRFMHELLQLDFVNTNSSAVQFLPKILADAFTDHRFFTTAHSQYSAMQFLRGESYAPKLLQIFTDLCQFFNHVLASSVADSTRRGILRVWFCRISQSVYSAPSLSFMFFACAPNIGDNALRIIDTELLNNFRETLNSHMASSETEFKFLFAFSTVRMLISYVDTKSVQLYDLMRYVDRLSENLDSGVADFLFQALFRGVVVNDPEKTGYLLSTELSCCINRLNDLRNFDEHESVCLNKLLWNLLKLCTSDVEVESVTTQLTSFITSVVGKLSTNPYIPIHRVFLALDLLFSASTLSSSQNVHALLKFDDWCKKCIASNCEDICLFFGTQTAKLTSESLHMWKKWAEAIKNSNLTADALASLSKMIVSLFEQYLSAPDASNSGAVFSLAVLLLTSCANVFTNQSRDLLTQVITRVIQKFDRTSVASRSQNIAHGVFQLKNVIAAPPFNQTIASDTMLADMSFIIDNVDVLGTDALALSAVCFYIGHIMNKVTQQKATISGLEEIISALCRTVDAIFSQVRQIIESADSSWRLLLHDFIATFFQRRYIEGLGLRPIIEKVVDVLHSISQSRHEVWQTLLCHVGEKPDADSLLFIKNEQEEDAVAQLAIDILCKSLAFGQVGRRSRFFAESYYALRQVYSDELSGDEAFEKIVSQQMVSPAMIRLQAMRLLSSPSVSASFSAALIDHQLDDCVRWIEKIGDKRPFTNSQSHRDEHRILLAIVFLLDKLDRTTGNAQRISEKLWTLCVVRILPKQLYTSVRNLAQWIVVLLLSIYPDKFFDQLLAAYDKAITQHQSSSLLSSYLDIIGCAAYFLIENSTACIEEKRVRLTKVFDRLLPACLFNHFLMRARAQAALVRLWASSQYSRSVLMPTTFDSHFLDQCVAVARDETNKPVKRNLNSFFYRLSPIGDYFGNNGDGRLLPILHFFLPRSSDLFVDEFAFRCDFRAVELKANQRLDNSSTSLELWNRLEDQFGVDFEPSKPDDVDNLHTVSTIDSDGTNGDQSSGVIQRKLTNWRKLVPGYDEDAVDDGGVQQPKSRPCSDLILVASLVDKASNLGGLCRSADVFGLSTISLPSIDRTKDHEFESLAVSAHKWLKIIEVSPHMLVTFLLSLKREGFTLVAAEQATGSVPLPQFKFPRKTALILGNEREGIPPHILQLIDNCVEIDQYGVAVRSLNVHVTGALFMYSYSCQHASKS